MEYENIVYVKEGRLAYIVINRPEVRNALNQAVLDEIEDALDRAERDDEAGVVVFTGQGEKAFAAGADIQQLTEAEALDALKNGDMQQLYDKVEAFQKPTIAMINGFALGGGCELAMSCDIRIASIHASFGLPELALSIIPRRRRYPAPDPLSGKRKGTGNDFDRENDFSGRSPGGRSCHESRDTGTAPRRGGGNKCGHSV